MEYGDQYWQVFFTDTAHLKEAWNRAMLTLSFKDANTCYLYGLTIRLLSHPVINYQTSSSMLRRLFARVCRIIQVSSAECYEIPRTWKWPQKHVHKVLYRRPQGIRRCPPGRVSLWLYLIHTRYFGTFINNVKHQLVGKTVRAYGSFVTLQAR